MELLPPAAQDLVRSTYRLCQQAVLGYWREILDERQADLDDTIEQATAAVRDAGVPYRLIVGSQLDSDQRRWLTADLPAATIDVWPGARPFPT